MIPLLFAELVFLIVAVLIQLCVGYAQICFLEALTQNLHDLDMDGYCIASCKTLGLPNASKPKSCSVGSFAAKDR